MNRFDIQMFQLTDMIYSSVFAIDGAIIVLSNSLYWHRYVFSYSSDIFFYSLDSFMCSVQMMIALEKNDFI